MNWLLIFLGGLLEQLFGFFAKKAFRSIAIVGAYIAFYIGLYLTFLIAFTAGMWALEPLIPTFIPFALSMIPPVAFTMMNFYFTALVARRVFDWHKRATKDFTQAMLL